MHYAHAHMEVAPEYAVHVHLAIPYNRVPAPILPHAPTQQNLEHARQLLHWLDCNGDGKVTYAEFRDLGALLAVGEVNGSTLKQRVETARL